MNASSISRNMHASQHVPKIALSKESASLLQRLKKISASYFFRSDRVLINKLKAMEPIELSNVLKAFFMEMVQEDGIKDPAKFFDRVSRAVPFENLQEAIKGNVEDVLKESKEMFEEAKLYLQMTSEKTPPSIRARISSIIDGIISVLESIVTAFGIGDFFKPAESEIQVDFKEYRKKCF